MSFAGFLGCLFVFMAVSDGKKHFHRGKLCHAFFAFVILDLLFAALFFAFDLT